MASNKVQINLCSYNELLQIPSIGKATAMRIYEIRRITPITPELLASLPYIKMDVLNEYVDYTRPEEVEFRDHEEYEWSEKGESESEVVEGEFQEHDTYHDDEDTRIEREVSKSVSDMIERLWDKTQIAAQEPFDTRVTDKFSSTYSFRPQELTQEITSDRLNKTYEPPVKQEVSTPQGYELYEQPSTFQKQKPITPQYQEVSYRAPSITKTKNDIVETPGIPKFRPTITSTTTHTSKKRKIAPRSNVTNFWSNRPSQSGIELSQFQKARPTNQVQSQGLPQNTAPMYPYASQHPTLQTPQLIPTHSSMQQPHVLNQHVPLNPRVQQSTVHFQPQLQVPQNPQPQVQPSFLQTPLQQSSQSIPPMPPIMSQNFSQVPPTPNSFQNMMNTDHSESMTNFNKQTFAPKSLKFDGTDKNEDWVSFVVKFEMYADAYQWTDTQKRAQLCWAMTGTAGKFCSAILRREKNITFQELVNRMEKRFNLRKLVATLQVQFNNARQSENEDIDEWADRLLALADKAFRDLPEDYVTNQVVTKLCQGCLDKQVGSVAASFQPKSVEDALERIKWLQYSNQAIFGRTVRTRDPSIEVDNTDVSVQVTKVADVAPNNVMEKHIDSLKNVIQDTMKTFNHNIDKVQTNVEKVQTDMKNLERQIRQELKSALNTTKLQTTENQTKNVSQSQNQPNRRFYRFDRSDLQCWTCGEYGHTSRLCSHNKGSQRPANKDPVKEDLNTEGSSA